MANNEKPFMYNEIGAGSVDSKAWSEFLEMGSSLRTSS